MTIEAMSDRLAPLQATLKSVLRSGETTPAGRRVARGEVLGVAFSRRFSPRDTFHAFCQLLQLRESGDFESYQAVLKGIWSGRPLARRLATPRNPLPLLSVVVDSEDKLAAFESFISSGDDASVAAPSEPFELVFAVKVGRNAVQSIPRVISIVRRVERGDSMFKITMVELTLTAVDLSDEASTILASSLCRLLLMDIPATEFDVSLSLRVGRSGECNQMACGEFFQTVWRVGAQSTTNCFRAEELVACPREAGNSLQVSIDQAKDDRITSAFWSAVAYSRGYTHLIYDRDETSITNAKAVVSARPNIFLAMLMLGHSDICVLHWGQSHLPRKEFEMMTAVRKLSPDKKSDKLIKLLWEQDKSGPDCFLEVATLDQRIAEEYGFVLHDVSHGDFIDVFVPGYAQLTVRRTEWLRGLHARDHPVQNHHSPNLPFIQDVRGGHPTPSHLQLPTTVETSLLSVNITTPIDSSGLLTILHSCPELRRLKVGQLQPPTSPLSAIFAPKLAKLLVVNLSHLTVHSFPDNESSWFDAFFSGLVPIIGSQLAHVELSVRSRNPISVDLSCRALLTMCPHLQDIYLVGVKLDSLSIISNILSKSDTKLAKLVLTDCQIRRDRLIQFATQFSKQDCSQTFRTLIIEDGRRFDDEKYGFDMRTFVAYLAMASFNRGIREMQLRTNRPIGWFDRKKQLQTTVEEFRVKDEIIDSKWQQKRCAIALIGALQRRPSLPWEEETLRLIIDFAGHSERNISACIGITGTA